MKTNSIAGGHAWSGAGQLALAEGRLPDALAALDKELSYYPTQQAYQRAWSEGMRGAVYLAMGEYATAERHLTNSLPTLQKRFGDSHFRVRRAVRDLAKLYTDWGKPDQAAEWKQKLAELDKAAKESQAQAKLAAAAPAVTPKPIASTSWGTTNGAIIGQFFIHQSGLPAAEMPIHFGSDVRDWWVHPKQQPAGKDPATIA